MLTTQCLAYSLAQQQRWQWQRQRRRWQQRQQQSAHPLRYSTFRPANRAALIQRAGSFPVRPQSTSARTCSDGGVMLLLLVKAAPAGKALGSEPPRGLTLRSMITRLQCMEQQWKPNKKADKQAECSGRRAGGQAGRQTGKAPGKGCGGQQPLGRQGTLELVPCEVQRLHAAGAGEKCDE